MACSARPLPAGTARSETQTPSPAVVPHPVPQPPATDIVCTVADSLAVTPDVRVLRLRVPADAAFRFHAGQYARLDVPGVGHRYFSIGAPPPRDGAPARLLEFHVRAAPGSETGRVLHEGVRPGDPIAVHGPLGRAWWAPGDPRPLLLVGGGTGFAPVLAIAEAALAAGLTAPVRVYVGMRDEHDLYHEDRLQALARAHANLRCEVVLSEPSPHVTGRRHGNVGDVLAGDLAGPSPMLPGTQVYLAGPPAMVQTTRDLLGRLGVDPSDVHGDG